MNSRLLEGIKKIYSGKDIVYKQISLFSIIGILSILGAYLYLGKASFFTIKSFTIWIVAIMEFVWTFYFIGYETKLINNIFHSPDNIVPEMNTEPVKIMYNKFPLVLFIINSLIILASITTHKENLIFLLTIVISMIMTLFQIGFAKQYSDSDILDIFKVLKIKDYIVIFIKRILINLAAFITSYGVVFVAVLIAGLIVLLTGFVHSHSFSEIVASAQSSQLALTKLSIYSTTILLNYFMTIGNLAWDYDVVKLFEERSKQS